MNTSGVRGQGSGVGINRPSGLLTWLKPCFYVFILFTIHCSLFTILIGCQTPALTPKGAVINKTNPNFLKEAGVDDKTNPHIDQKCQVCHTAPDNLLTKENPAENEIILRKLMRTDLINLCSQCHKASVENEHVVGVETKLNRQNLPLDPQGKITCATTCHDVHTKAPGLSRLLDPNGLCFSCHDV